LATLAHIEVLKLKLDEQKRLEAERGALIAELEATLSPELALQVEVIIDRRSSFVIPDGTAATGDRMTPFAALNHTTSEAQARATAHVVPFTPRTRARSDHFNPEAEQALSPRSHEPNGAERAAGTVFDCVVPYAGPGAELQVRASDHADLTPSGAVHWPSLLSLQSHESPDGDDECSWE
jgi:hypothetical protein